MPPEKDSQTTLSKWPFILSDALLVATGLAIAILGKWQLTNWQVGACVAAVALGAALFVLPYLVEFQVRVREEREDRAAEWRILERQILATQALFDGLDARMRSLEDASADASALMHTERPDAEARARLRPEQSGLLHRAILAKGDQSAAAVTRIIAAKSKTEMVEKLPDSSLE